MTPEFKQKWLEALRSGRYAQGRSALRSLDDRYCCLGVACDIVRPDGWVNSRRDGTYGHISSADFGFPKQQILDEIGITMIQAWELVDMNDSGESFKTIAAYIEKNL